MTRCIVQFSISTNNFNWLDLSASLSILSAISCSSLFLTQDGWKILQIAQTICTKSINGIWEFGITCPKAFHLFIRPLTASIIYLTEVKEVISLNSFVSSVVCWCLFCRKCGIFAIRLKSSMSSILSRKSRSTIKILSDVSQFLKREDSELKAEFNIVIIILSISTVWYQDF